MPNALTPITGAVAQGWQTLSLGSSGTANTPMQARRELADICRVRGSIALSAAISSGYTFFTLPSGLIPAFAQYVIVRAGTGTAYVLFGTDGTVKSQSGISTGSNVYFDSITVVVT